MKIYDVELYSENSFEIGTSIKARSRNHAVRKTIKINKKYYQCKYIQIWEPVHKGFIKIFGHGNTYLYGKKNGKKVEINGQR